jgi:hypothetical protein
MFNETPGMKFTTEEAIFGWTFTTMSWNTMGGSHSVGSVMLQHIHWKGDCLVITFAKRNVINLEKG